jgi:hypothetical protein
MTKRTITIIVIAAVATLALLVVLCGFLPLGTTSGLCNRCHKDGDPGVDSCRECQAWGATRHVNWLCRACVTWCQNYPAVKPCTVCGQPRHVGFWGREVCRLCYKQASMLRYPDENSI